MFKRIKTGKNQPEKELLPLYKAHVNKYNERALFIWQRMVHVSYVLL